jgi:hypothetical protein
VRSRFGENQPTQHHRLGKRGEMWRGDLSPLCVLQGMSGQLLVIDSFFNLYIIARRLTTHGDYGLTENLTAHRLSTAQRTSRTSTRGTRSKESLSLSSQSGGAAAAAAPLGSQPLPLCRPCPPAPL